jgi:hypothetical protein
MWGKGISDNEILRQGISEVSASCLSPSNNVLRSLFVYPVSTLLSNIQYDNSYTQYISSKPFYETLAYKVRVMQWLKTLVGRFPHTHNQPALFSLITILIAIAAARDNPYSRAGYYTIRLPAAKCRGNPP